jgi:flagellar hook assembly protein FlgD
LFQIEINDIVGNMGQAAITFNDSGDFELLAIASHPNPFIDETIIAYALSDQAELVKIQIYTAAGRLIRSFNYAGEMGYLEHDWDGRDEFGNEVANGVYYLKFEAIKANERIKTIEKMAKLR